MDDFIMGDTQRQDDENNYGDEEDAYNHEILVQNQFQHIPGPAGEIFISDDHLQNQQLYQQQFTQMQRRNLANKSMNSKNGSKEKKAQEEYERNLLVTLEHYFQSNGIGNGIQYCKEFSVQYMKTGNNFERKVKLAALSVKNLLRYDSVQSANVLLGDFYRTKAVISNSSATSLTNEETLMEATIHKTVIDKYPHVLTPGTLLLLKKFCIFHPSPRTYHLIITLKNIVNIFSTNLVQKRIEKNRAIGSQSSVRSTSSMKSKTSQSSNGSSPQEDHDKEGSTDQQSRYPPFVPPEEEDTNNHAEPEPVVIAKKPSATAYATSKEKATVNLFTRKEPLSRSALKRKFTTTAPQPLEQLRIEDGISETLDYMADAHALVNMDKDDQASQELFEDDAFTEDNVSSQNLSKKRRLELEEDDDYEDDRKHGSIPYVANKTDDDKQKQQQQQQIDQVEVIQEAIHDKLEDDQQSATVASVDDFDLFADDNMYDVAAQDDTTAAAHEQQTLGDHVDNLEIQDLQNEDEFF